MKYTTKFLETGWVQVLIGDALAYEYMKFAHGWLLWRPGDGDRGPSNLLLIHDPNHNQPPLPVPLKLWGSDSPPVSGPPAQIPPSGSP